MKWLIIFYSFSAAVILWMISLIWSQLELTERFEDETLFTLDDIKRRVQSGIVPSYLHNWIPSYEPFALEVQTPHGTDPELGEMMGKISEVGNQLNEDSRYDRVDERILAERRAEKNLRK
jgi:hypothetical protein